MQSVFYRASFYLYELSFMVFGLSLVYAAMSFRKINMALKHPPLWLGPFVAGILLVLCAINHFVVYHFLSPQYMVSQSKDLLITMYLFKTISMASILIAGLMVAFSYLMYWKKIKTS